MLRALVVSISFVFLNAAAHAEDCVVLLHGLASNPLVMKPMEVAIDIQPEFRVVNQGYRSYSADIETLAHEVLPKAIAACDLKPYESVSFVTHSLGGIILRAYLAENELAALDSVVMLAPPNHGSEVVDWVGQFRWLIPILGPAGRQLGTEDDDLPTRLPDAEFKLGVIAGNISESRERWFFWTERLPGEDDGKVSTQSAKLGNMSDYTQVEASHSGLLIEKAAIEQVLSFLRYGRFDIDQVSCQSSQQLEVLNK